MVTIKYNAHDDEVEMTSSSIENELIERKFHNCLNWQSDWSFLLQTKT